MRTNFRPCAFPGKVAFCRENFDNNVSFVFLQANDMIFSCVQASQALPLSLLCALAPALFSRVAFAETTPLSAAASETRSTVSESTPSKSALGAVRGEAQTLPQGVFRWRAVYTAARAATGWSDSGQKEDGGWRAALDSAALVMEYGLRPGFSLQLVAPVVLRSERSLDGAKFNRSSFYTRFYNEKLTQLIDKLVENKFCADAVSCRTAIEEKSLSFPYTNIVLDTGETLELKSAVPIKNVLGALVSNSAVPEAGATGRGDLELGALLAVADPEVGLVRNWKVNVSIGLGLRIPTGLFENVPTSQRPTGRGSWDLGVRANVDKVFSESLVLSWQNQSETTLVAGQKKRSSLLDNTKLNNADPTIEGGDGRPNTGRFKRSTLRQVGFVKLALGCETLVPNLKNFILNSAFKYDLDSPGEVEGQTLGPDTSLMSAQLGLTWDGLRTLLPVQLDLDYSFPIAGRSISAAPHVFSSALKVYQRF
jgi:hypothetical protein